MRLLPWHIVTGEYAPAPGGVAGYTRLIARALAQAGDEVHVWTPPAHQPLAVDPGVLIHPLPHGYRPRGLVHLATAFRETRRPCRILVQYVPNAFGAKGMNLPFCAWLSSLRDVSLWVMLHEVTMPWHPLRQWKQNTVSFVNRAMVRLLATRADRIFVSIPAWVPMLRSIAPRWNGEATWLPVPSNVPLVVSDELRSATRARLGVPADAIVVGHFGTFGTLVTPTLLDVLGRLLRGDDRRLALVIGHGSDAFARSFEAREKLNGRVFASGSLESDDEIAAYLLASDILVQPVVDGVSSRRTSVMAGLALALPVATNEGRVSEPLWRTQGIVELAPSLEKLTEAAEMLLRDRDRAAELGRRGRAFYETHFALERTVQTLRAEPQ